MEVTNKLPSIPPLPYVDFFFDFFASLKGFGWLRDDLDCHEIDVKEPDERNGWRWRRGRGRRIGRNALWVSISINLQEMGEAHLFLWSDSQPWLVSTCKAKLFHQTRFPHSVHILLSLLFSQSRNFSKRFCNEIYSLFFCFLCSIFSRSSSQKWLRDTVIVSRDLTFWIDCENSDFVVAPFTKTSFASGISSLDFAPPLSPLSISNCTQQLLTRPPTLSLCNNTLRLSLPFGPYWLGFWTLSTPHLIHLFHPQPSDRPWVPATTYYIR